MAYTAGDVLVRSVMTAASGLPRDVIVNDWAFRLPGAPVAQDYTDMFGWVDDFFNDVGSTGTAVGSFISNFVNRGATHSLQAYTIAAGGLGSPVAEIDWLGPNAAGADNGLPTECAGVLSFHADLTSILEEAGATRPRARRRGRVFIGPLTLGGVTTTTQPYMLGSGFRASLAAAGLKLRDDSGDTWSVWSRTDQTLRPVVAGWTDNAPDTQRRRGPRATVRSTWG